MAKALFTLFIISDFTLLMLGAGDASFISNNYQYVYAAAKNSTNTTPSPLGSKAFRGQLIECRRGVFTWQQSRLYLEAGARNVINV